MKDYIKYKYIAFVLILLLSPIAASAKWVLDSQHALVNFVSIKNNQIAELHSFSGLNGCIEDSGQALITIPLRSVNTGIDIRNERLQEHLFVTVEYPKASITAQLDQQWLASLEQGQAYDLTLEFTLDLHGSKQVLNALVGVIIDANGNLHVETIQPILLSAGLFGLNDGIAKLGELAGLQAIATAVPVTFAMVFKQQ